MKTSEPLEQAQRLLKLISDLLQEIRPHHKKGTLNLNDNFEHDLGLDSLSRVELISRVIESYHTKIPENELLELQTPAQLLEVLLGSEALPIINNHEKTPAYRLQETDALPHEAKTLVDVLLWQAQEYPDRPHIQLYEDEGEGETITYGQLKERALKVANGLQELGLQPAQAVAIMLPTSDEYFYSFFGILLAGGIPVPIYPPSRPSQIEEHIQRHTGILNNCEATILITLPEASQVAKLLRSFTRHLDKIITFKELISKEEPCVLPRLHPEDTAFIQYTSGSTGDPKGVVLSHANLLANIRSMGESVQASSKDVFVSWLPLYHDMGLIGAWLGSLYHTALFVVMSPLSFLSKPQRWLWAIHRYGGTLSASPNFGYEYCLHRLKATDLGELNLSSWRAAFNGAEAVSPLSIESFTEHFSSHGFDPGAMTPVYGLAESSVGLVFPPMGRGAVIDCINRERLARDKVAIPVEAEEKQLQCFVSSGTPLRGHQIRIIDPAGNELPERHEGELQFLGPSSTLGYYKNVKKSQELFDGEWLKTGDRAYIADGELYMTGRKKDIIIRAGRNIYPDELEKAIGDVEGIRKGCVAVFGTFDKESATERVVVLAETKDKQKKEQLHRSINKLSTELIGGAPDEIILAPQGSVLKTSSGKIRRAATKALFEQQGEAIGKENLLWQLSRLGLKSLFRRVYRLIRLMGSYLYGFYSWTLFCTLSFFAWIALILLPGVQMRWKVIQGCTYLLAKLTRICIKVNGLQNLPKELKGSVLVSNHASYIDAMVLIYTLPKAISFIAKAELSSSWISRIPLERLKTRFVERFETLKSVEDSKELCSQLKQKNEGLLFFPEGTFTRIPGLKPFHLGAFDIAAKLDVPLIPIAIRGTRSVLRSDTWLPRHADIEITIGEVISLNEEEKRMDEWHQALALSEKSRRFILKHAKEPDLIYE